MPISKRQEYILKVLSGCETAGNKVIFHELIDKFDKVSRITLVRDLNDLRKLGLVKKYGEGRGVSYSLAGNKLLRPVNLNSYFAQEADEREIQKAKISFIYNAMWKDVFNDNELKHLQKLTSDFKKRLGKYKGKMLQKELERITIEFSWKSSRIEGNTYSLLDTERLIKDRVESKMHTREETLMILNHKTALDYIWSHPKYFSTISLRKIEDIHSLLVKNMSVATGLRKHPVGIIGTAYKPYDNIYQIRETLNDLCVLINKLKDPFSKSLVTTAGLSYIQPFADGNKRTSRLAANGVLLANNCCPLSYRSVDEVEYKKAMILFYEQHTLAAFKKIFVEQYEFALKNYFL